MKKIIIIMIALTLSAGAFAQKGFRSHGVRVYTYVTPAFGYGFNYGYPFFGYPYFGYPFAYGPYSYAYGPMSSYKLNEQINAVKSEYRYKIKAARKDKSISKAQRKQNILQLKSERENAIATVEKNYRTRRMNMYNQQGVNNSQNGTNNNKAQPNNNSSGSNNDQNL